MKREDITKLSRLILKDLKSHSLLKAGVPPEEKILAKIDEIIFKNLADEAAIEEEARKLMEQFKSKIASGSVDPQKAYMMIKKQVAKERKFIL